MADSNPVIEAVMAGHVTAERSIDGFLDYLPQARCKLDGESFPCSAVLAARAANARRLAAQNRAQLAALTPALLR